MVVSLTSLRLRSVWSVFRLYWWGSRITRQAQGSKGFVKIRIYGWWRMHYTATVWETEADAKAFARSGVHLEAMRESAKLATEIQIYTFTAEEIPPWREAKILVAKNGRTIRYSAVDTKVRET